MKSLKERREALGLMQRELAMLIDVADKTVSRYENGKLALPDYAELIIALLELSPANLAFALKRRGLPVRDRREA